MEVTNINRRKFLKIGGISGAFLAVGFQSFRHREPELINLTPEDLVNGTTLNPFVILSEDGSISIMATIPELGQGIHQGLPAVIAEELEVDLAQVTVVKSGVSRKYGRQSIGGSRSVRTLFQSMQKSGAAAREVLVQTAANRWKVGRDQCYAKLGKVYKKNSSQSIEYKDLVVDAAKLEVPQNPPVKEKKDFKIIGNAADRADLPDKVNGTTKYAIDTEPENLLYATIERCPTLQGKILSYDEEAAMKVKGVKKVMPVTRTLYGKKNTGIAVVADTYFAATQGRKKLNAKWDNSAFTKVSTKSLFDDMKQIAGEKLMSYDNKGAFDGHFGAATDKLDVIYELPYLSHTCMEPMNATFHVKEDDTVEMWVPSQRPQVHQQYAKEMGIPENLAEEKIKIHLPCIGGDIGRRGMNDSLEECFQISKALRKPVKLIWSREDDTSQGPFRQGTVHVMRATFDEKGQPSGVQHKMISQSITNQARATKDRLPGEVMEGMNKNYNFEDYSIQFGEYKGQIPVHWWRSVFASTNGMAHEAFIDEVAVKAKIDPLKFRKEKLQSAPRFVKVLEKLEKESNWNEKLGSNESKGLAIVESYGSIVAHALFLKKENGKVTIPKVVSVVDCGIYINPDQVKAQTEGNIIYGLTAALKDPITFRDGAAEQTNFHNYRMLRMNEAPKDIQVHLMENNEAPGGVGEPGLPPIAPALVNAVYDLTGKRIRKLPFDLQKV